MRPMENTGNATMVADDQLMPNETDPHYNEGDTAFRSSLVPKSHNTYRHGAQNLTLIARSLREVGAARSVAGDNVGSVLAGKAA